MPKVKSLQITQIIYTFRRKLSAEEMERRRAEMMSDAKWRDEQRATNIERYRKEDDHEKKKIKEQLGKEADFIRCENTSKLEMPHSYFFLKDFLHFRDFNLKIPVIVKSTF